MAVYLTNGKCYIAHNLKGSVIKVAMLEQAQDFHTVERAMHQIKKAPAKCSGYYWIETEEQPAAQEGNTIQNKRKKFSVDSRQKIYRKTYGHCYLCGEFIDYNKFEIEHRIPLAHGGTNDIENLFPACHTCNSLKGSIVPQDLMEKIKQIQLYQMKRKYKGGIRYRLAKYVLSM